MPGKLSNSARSPDADAPDFPAIVCMIMMFVRSTCGVVRQNAGRLLPMVRRYFRQRTIEPYSLRGRPEIGRERRGLTRLSSAATSDPPVKR
jgi:hypothetical protein